MHSHWSTSGGNGRFFGACELSTAFAQRGRELWKGSSHCFFRLVPERVHLCQIRLARRSPALAQPLLDVVEARLESPQRAAQRLFRMHLHPPAQVCRREEEIPELV